MTLTREEFEEFLADAISDSIDMDWQPSWGARQIIRELERNGRLNAVLEAIGEL